MPDISELTDEQIMSMTAPPVNPEDVVVPGAAEETVTQTPEEIAEAARLADEAAAAANPSPGSDAVENGGGEDTSGGATLPANGEAQGDKSSNTATVTEGAAAPVKGDAAAGNETPKDGQNAPAAGSGDGAAQDIDYKAAYEQLMAPFTANGKTIDLKKPEELKQLAQMGANYTRKMQELAPVRKHMLMLQNNGLMNEDEISFFIDLKNKNPEAIKKLLKDAQFDPNDHDLDAPSTYQRGNHTVDDKQVVFTSVLEDVRSSTKGAETLQAINTWDQASKDALWDSPQIMAAIHQQRESGVYDLIKAEVDRRTIMGQIPAGTSFLAAYKAVGDEMAAEAQKQVPAQAAAAAPVASRTAAPKPVVANGAKATAASSSRAAPAKATAAPFNPLELSDEEFLKHSSPPFASKV